MSDRAAWVRAAVNTWLSLHPDIELLAVTVAEPAVTVDLAGNHTPDITELIGTIQIAARHPPLEWWCRPLREFGVSFRCVVVDHDAMPLLCEIADIVDADFIVVGGTKRGELREFLFGGVGFVLAHHGYRPVVIVPPTARRQVRPQQM